MDEKRAVARPHRVEVAIAGGGLTGLALAAALGRAGTCLALVEQAPLASLVEPEYDGRVTAVARGSQRFLASLGAWPAIAPEAEPILEIVVREAGSPVGVHYDHREVGNEPLGWIVPNRTLRLALQTTIADLTDLDLFTPARIVAAETGTGGLRLELADGRAIETALLAVCEGRLSPTRELLGIGDRRFDYRQLAIVCTLRHERPHRGRAVERFFPDGPFAILPMRGRRSSIVWALEAEKAAAVRALDDRAFAAEVEERFGDLLGGIEIEGPRFYFPLVLVESERITAPRVALVGDAARGIHPIAGQGWNLALRDVAALAEVVEERLRLGLDPGDASALDRYAAWRSFDGLALVSICHGIERLFSNDVGPLKLLRNLGLGLVERLPPAKRFFMRHAMGLVGELPRSMRSARSA
ncbi:MAG: 2-octaprenyl-3-methyl-6-methoxy-1,4-benzoquinol hydroxylase [Geminicoccaceae bacterium]|nr:MAG: 2-octaprenyl-3-methyl-6-methoxy-1,4-benzoquinol hydroxylase [Geminicoccaceae bacterium]